MGSVKILIDTLLSAVKEILESCLTSYGYWVLVGINTYQMDKNYTFHSVKKLMYSLSAWTGVFHRV